MLQHATSEFKRSNRLASRRDECTILIKALPHRSSSYFETVCCAGIGCDGRWRRQYPVPFRILAEPQKFRRWDRISYEFTEPAHDGRGESQKVVPESIRVVGSMPQRERARLLNPLIRDSLSAASDLGQSLALVRPEKLVLSWERKSDAQLSDETIKHAALANQLSMLDAPAKPLTPCPYAFTIEWIDARGARHSHICDDWETSTAFFRRRKVHGEEGALASLKKTYEDEYASKGVALGFSTHSRRNGQWLLVAILRLDDSPQHDLLM